MLSVMCYFDILLTSAAKGVSQYIMCMKTSLERVLDMCRSFAVRIISFLEDLYFTFTSNEAVFKKKISAQFSSYFSVFHPVLIFKIF